MVSSSATATIVGRRENPASRSASWSLASRTTSCAEGGRGGRGGRRSTNRSAPRSSRKVKFEPPPSPIRRARTSPEPSRCSSRNARTRSSTSSGAPLRVSGSRSRLDDVARRPRSRLPGRRMHRAILWRDAPAALSDAARSGVVLRSRRKALRSGEGLTHRPGSSAGRGGKDSARARDLRPRSHERASSHRGDGEDRGSEPQRRARGVARAARAPRRAAVLDSGGRARGRVRPRLPRGRAHSTSASWAERRSARSSTAFSPRSSGCSATATGTPRSPSCTAV